MALKNRPKSYGTWRYYKGAIFANVEDDTCSIPPCVIRQILSATGFRSVAAFNRELRRHEYGKIPKRLQHRLKSLLAETCSDDWEHFPIETEQVESPLMLDENPPPAEIEIYHMAIKKVDWGHCFELSAAITTTRYFRARPGEEAICALLIRTKGRAFDELKPSEGRVFQNWIRRKRIKVSSLGSAFGDAVNGMERATEAAGIMSKTFADEMNEPVDYFVECSDGEASGFQ